MSSLLVQGHVDGETPPQSSSSGCPRHTHPEFVTAAALTALRSPTRIESFASTKHNTQDSKLFFHSSRRRDGMGHRTGLGA